jgi:hypothetical protein
MANGSIFLVGGSARNSMVYDPKTNAYAPLPWTEFGAQCSAVRMADHRVVVAGGEASSNALQVLQQLCSRAVRALSAHGRRSGVPT